MARAGKLAADMAETLKAAMVNDPLFGGAGAAGRPGPAAHPAARQAGAGLGDQLRRACSSDAAAAELRQPVADGAVRVDQAEPGRRPSARRAVRDGRGADARAVERQHGRARQSTIALASQARKYGLGLVFATQAPKGLHNQIPGNATTQFFGLLNAPAQIDAAREMAQAKGGRLPDIGLLGSGSSTPPARDSRS